MLYTNQALKITYADVAEQADALDSGSSGSNTVWVQVPSSAPGRVFTTKVSTRFYFCVPKGFFITGVVNTRFYFFIKVHLIYFPVFAENSL